MNFGPNPDEARTLDARMNKGLRESLEHISEAVAGAARESQDENGRRVLTELHDLIRPVPDVRFFSPAAFGHYYELAIALAGDDFEAARLSARRLRDCAPRGYGANGQQILALGQNADRDEIYMRRMGDVGASFNPPPDSALDEFRPRLEAARALLRRSAPELVEEIDIIVREMVLAVGNPRAKLQFDGASHYQLWGLLFLNPTFHSTAVALAEVLAHESGHSILFGHTYHEPLVFNPDDELYPSALRLDPRPMDGVYHATWVSARMHWTMSRVANDPAASAEERAAARKAADEDAVNFAKGIDVIDAHGQLSETGRRLMDSARAYMESAA